MLSEDSMYRLPVKEWPFEWWAWIRSIQRAWRMRRDQRKKKHETKRLLLRCAELLDRSGQHTEAANTRRCLKEGKY